MRISGVPTANIAVATCATGRGRGVVKQRPVGTPHHHLLLHTTRKRRYQIQYMRKRRTGWVRIFGVRLSPTISWDTASHYYHTRPSNMGTDNNKKCTTNRFCFLADACITILITLTSLRPTGGHKEQLREQVAPAWHLTFI